eukprot:scaffold3399_cov117-Cylindrotheca_fusiformis.AAC.7
MIKSNGGSQRKILITVLGIWNCSFVFQRFSMRSFHIIKLNYSLQNATRTTSPITQQIYNDHDHKTRQTEMFSFRCNHLLVSASNRLGGIQGPIRRYSNKSYAPAFAALDHRTDRTTRTKPSLLGFLRSFSSSEDDSNKIPPHKQIIPPMPETPSYIVEPPVRNRPFRNFRGARAPQMLRAPKRRIAQTPMSLQKLGTYPVQAVQVAQSIDIPKVISKVFATKAARKMMERLSVVVQLPRDEQNDSHRFIAVFRFGSVVFFNVAPRDMSNLLERIKTCSTDIALSGTERRENFCVHVQPELPLDDQNVVTGEYCVVQELNMKSVDVISNVMAQSVALDSYNDTVDELLANFELINQQVTATGDLTSVDKDKMFRAVARNNSIFIEMVSKVGIKDRLDTAWNLSQYEDVHDGMKEEFDIDIRFEHIEFKLNLIQQNAKFFLDVLSQQKSNTLEWIIIVLITFECVLMCGEMSGAGEMFFAQLNNLLK